MQIISTKQFCFFFLLHTPVVVQSSMLRNVKRVLEWVGDLSFSSRGWEVSVIRTNGDKFWCHRWESITRSSAWKTSAKTAPWELVFPHQKIPKSSHQNLFFSKHAIIFLFSHFSYLLLQYHIMLLPYFKIIK